VVPEHRDHVAASRFRLGLETPDPLDHADAVGTVIDQVAQKRQRIRARPPVPVAVDDARPFEHPLRALEPAVDVAHHPQCHHLHHTFFDPCRRLR
jgi:hypothetical protein